MRSHCAETGKNFFDLMMCLFVLAVEQYARYWRHSWEQEAEEGHGQAFKRIVPRTLVGTSQCNRYEGSILELCRLYDD